MEGSCNISGSIDILSTGIEKDHVAVGSCGPKRRGGGGGGVNV